MVEIPQGVRDFGRKIGSKISVGAERIYVGAGLGVSQKEWDRLRRSSIRSESVVNIAYADGKSHLTPDPARSGRVENKPIRNKLVRDLNLALDPDARLSPNDHTKLTPESAKFWADPRNKAVLEFYLNKQLVTNYRWYTEHPQSVRSSRDLVTSYLNYIGNIYRAQEPQPVYFDGRQTINLGNQAQASLVELIQDWGYFQSVHNLNELPSLQALRSGALERIQETGEGVSLGYVINQAGRRLAQTLVRGGRGLDHRLRGGLAEVRNILSGRREALTHATPDTRAGRERIRGLVDRVVHRGTHREAELNNRRLETFRAELEGGADLKGILEKTLARSEDIVDQGFLKDHPQLRTALTQVLVPTGTGLAAGIAIRTGSQILFGRVLPVTAPVVSYLSNRHRTAKDFYSRVHPAEVTGRAKIAKRGLRAFNILEDNSIKAVAGVEHRESDIRQIISTWYEQRGVAENRALSPAELTRWWQTANSDQRTAFIEEYKVLRLQSELTGDSFQIREAKTGLIDEVTTVRKALLDSYRQTLTTVLAAEVPVEEIDRFTPPLQVAERSAEVQARNRAAQMAAVKQMADIERDIDSNLRQMASSIRLRIAGAAAVKSVAFTLVGYGIGGLIEPFTQVQAVAPARPAIAAAEAREALEQRFAGGGGTPSGLGTEGVKPSADLGATPPAETVTQVKTVKLSEGIGFLREDVRRAGVNWADYGIDPANKELTATTQKLINGTLEFGDTGKHWALLQNGFRRLASEMGIPELSEEHQRKMAGLLAKAIMSWNRGELDDDSPEGILFHYANGTRSLLGKLDQARVREVLVSLKP